MGISGFLLLEIGFFLGPGVGRRGFEVGILGFCGIFVFLVDGRSNFGIEGFLFFGLWLEFWLFSGVNDFLGVFSVIFDVFSICLTSFPSLT